VEQDQKKLDQKVLNQLLLQNTSQTILYNTKLEFSKLLTQLDGNEDLQKIGSYFFEEGYRRLSSQDKHIMDDLVEVLSKAFFEMVSDFKAYADIEERHDGNITVKVGQLVRYFNFIQCIINSDKNSRDIKYLISKLDEIEEFIFNNNVGWNPKEESWSREFKFLERAANNTKIGYEPYYALGVVEIIRTISNKKRHSNAFPKKFNTQFNFYNDFHQIIGVYNLALYSFIELIEAWVCVKPFLDNHLTRKEIY
jgi:hypothetical protein